MVNCKDCIYWHTHDEMCPMTYGMFDSYEDRYVIYDNTPDDGSGYCHYGKKDEYDVP